VDFDCIYINVGLTSKRSKSEIGRPYFL